MQLTPLLDRAPGRVIFPPCPGLDETAVTRAELSITFAKFFRLTVA
jgi:hypothetical protein